MSPQSDSTAETSFTKIKDSSTVQSGASFDLVRSGVTPSLFMVVVIVMVLNVDDDSVIHLIFVY